MSVTTQTQKRLPTIKAGFLTGLDYDQIGSKCGVTRRTIERDVHNWLHTGDFDVWIREEWIRLHGQIIHDDPTEAYRQVSKLVAKMVTQKAEIRSEHREEIVSKQEININVYNDAEKSILDKAARLLDSKSHRKPSDLH